MNTVPLGEVIVPARVIRAGHQDFPVLSMTMHDGLVPQADRFKKRIASASTQDYKVVQRGQLVVGFPIDEGVLDVQNLYDQAVVSPAYGVWNLTSSDLVDSRYLIKFLRSPKALTYYKAKLQGSTARRRSLPASVFLELPVFLPPLSEQQRIAAILDKADAIRTKRRQALDLLEAVISSEFVRRFGSPVRDDRWSRRVIGDFAETRLGKMLDKKKQNDGEVFPYLRNVNVQWFSIDLDDILEMKFSEREREILELRDGDILMCEGGEPGRCAVWRSSKKDIYFQKALHRIRLSEDVLPEYFVYCMRFMVEEGGLRDFVTSATIAHLTGEKLRTVQIPVPPVEEQMAFCQAANRAEQARKMVTDDAVRIDALFASLQSRAFKGEL